MNINLNLINPSSRPVRTSWDEDKMNELAQSIREQGVIVPVKVRPSFELPECLYHGIDWVSEGQYYRDEPCFWCTEHRYQYGLLGDEECEAEEVGQADAARETYGALFELVYGHRRVEAARRAGLTEIPAFVEGLEDLDALLQQIMENESREDVPYDQKAEGDDYALQVSGWSQAALARCLGVPANSINEALRWLKEYRQGTAVSVVDELSGPNPSRARA